jgi:hypothetical protein
MKPNDAEAQISTNVCARSGHTTDQRESILGLAMQLLLQLAGFSLMFVRSDPIW